MKKKLFLSMVALLLGVTSAFAQYSPSAATEVFKFSPFNDSNLLTLFYNALQDGRQYPTTAEFEAAGFDMNDIEFVRSHVRRAEVIDDQANQLMPSIKNTRRFWMNTPMGTAKLTGGYPNTNTGDDTYSMWNYTHMFGSWNHGLFQAPGCWIDAAHQNGTDILSGIKFFESWTPGSGDAAYSKLISEKNSDGTYKYVEPLINILLFFGSDGINYNWEDSSYGDADVVGFHKALYKKAAEKGFNNFHIGLYTSQSTLTSRNANSIFGDESGRTADTFLNYMGNDFATTFSASLKAAQTAMGTTDGLYAGAWIVTMNRSWTRFKDNDMGMVLWGEHENSRFWSNNVGTDASSFQANLQALYERAFSGGNRNPARRPTMQDSGNEWGWNGTTPPLSKFGGISTYFPERSAIQGKLPFHTYFNTGAGEVYNYKGKQTAGSWYNMSTQDIVPTYRWLVYQAGKTAVNNKIQPEFTIDDAYMGGACLRLSGQLDDNGADIILFRTKLTGNSGTPYAKMAVKTGLEGENATNLYLIIKIGSEWKEFPVGSTTGKTWEEKIIPLTGISSSDQIDFVGLRAKGSNPNYKVMIGQLELNDDVKTQPAAVKDLLVDVRKETTKKLSVKLSWQVDATGTDRAAYGMVFNDDANIDHFEVLYKDGEDGRVSLVSHVRSWASFVGDIPMEADTKPFIGVRAVSSDLKTYSEPVWVEVPRSSNVPAEDQGDGPTYGTSTTDPQANGYLTAIKTRYLTTVTTTGATNANLNYVNGKANIDSTNYFLIKDCILKVKQGDNINFNYVYFDSSDGLQWCIMKAYVDWNCNGYFEGSTDELIVEQGTANTCNSVENTPEGSVTGSPLHANGWSRSPLIPFSFKVPDDAVRGKCRLRMVFTDAWAAHPGPTGLTAKGLTIDFPVEITGDNKEREVIKVRDEGEADEPEGLTDGIKATKGEVSNAFVANGKLQFDNVQKAWIYTTDGKLVRFVKDPSMLNTSSFAPGLYIIKMQNQGVIRSRKLVIK
ncbi:MAG: endo-beta-N-acetylglucosaminidase [Bacteroidaceae bacterium]|nr:endo-beta-N-acetylglucosaminidase [Bacteroidaceae bacterium]